MRLISCPWRSYRQRVDMVCKEEKLTPELLKEAEPLLQKHWAEIAYYKDIPLDPDYELYLKMQGVGALRSYSARDEHGKLIGYAVYFVRPHPHYKQTLMAQQDILYVDPERRGMGLFLLKFADLELKKIGVELVSHHIKVAHDWSAAAEKLGYKKTDIIVMKRL